MKSSQGDEQVSVRDLENMKAKPAPSQVSSDLGEEVAILNIETGVYYGLDEVGARVWQLLQTETDVLAIRDSLLAEYEVEATQCEENLLDLMRQLNEEGLIEVWYEDGE